MIESYFTIPLFGSDLSEKGNWEFEIGTLGSHHQRFGATE